MTLLNNQNGQIIRIMNLLNTTDSYYLYLGRGERSDDAFLCRVVRDEAYDRFAFAEQELLAKFAALSNSDRYSNNIKQGGKNADYHYDWLFPICESNFSAEQLGGRKVNVLRVRDASLDDFVLLKHLKEATKIDARTAAWVLERFLRLQAFLDTKDNEHCFCFDPGRVLISPRKRRVVYIGWFDSLASRIDCKEIASELNINRMIDTILDWVILNDTSGEDVFIAWLKDAKYSFLDGDKALCSYLGLLHELWGTSYMPFSFIANGAWDKVVR